MKTNQSSAISQVVAGTPALALNLDEPGAVQRARVQRHATLLIDCGGLACQRMYGVGYVISQLLLLRRAGATIWLRNLNPPLRRCLKVLHLAPAFHFC